MAKNTKEGENKEKEKHSYTKEFKTETVALARKNTIRKYLFI